MVAATNANSAVNNVLAKALSAAPAAQTSSATGAGNANVVSGEAADDNEFTNLLNAFLGDNASAKKATTDEGKTVKSADAKDDQQAGTTDGTVPQWLLSPLVSQLPAAVTNAPPSADNADDAVDALVPANNATTNALLAQSLKQLSDGKKDSTDATADQQSADNFSGLLVNAGQGQTQTQAMPDASTLKQDALLAIVDKAKDDANHADGADGADDKSANAIQSMANFQSMTNNNNAATTAQYMIHSGVGSQQWATDVGNQLSLMIAHKTQSASLQLTPDNLGPVHVKIDVNNNQASVWFTAEHPDTRTALEQSLPQLRALFASQGMSLMDAGVFGQQSQQQPAYVSQQPQPSFGMTDMSNEVTMTQQVMKVGLLDTYV